MEIVNRSDPGKVVVLPKRWVVERAFAWLALSRRLNSGKARRYFRNFGGVKKHDIILPRRRMTL
jgi:transposase